MSWLSGYKFRKKITATGTTDTHWVSPTNFVDPSTAWNNEGNAYDNNTGTLADSDVGSITQYIELTHAELPCGKIRIWAAYYSPSAEYDYDLTLDVYYSGGWHNIVTDELHTKGQWEEVSLGSTLTISAARLKIVEKDGLGGSSDVQRLYEFEFNEVKTLTNYQLPVDVNYGAGGDSGLSVYCHSLCDTDFDDIRFTKADGDTELDYWLEEYTGSGDATFWVEFHSILPTATNYFYMYYGKIGDTTTSNGVNTFIKFDDFERGSNGDAPGGIWTVDLNSCEISTEQKFGGTRSMKLEGVAGNCHVSSTATIAASDNIAIRMRYYKETANIVYFMHGNGTTRVTVRFNESEDIAVFDGAAYIDTTLDCLADSWGLLEINNFDWTAQEVGLTVDGNSVTGKDVSYSNAAWNDALRFLGGGVGNDAWIDDFIVRNWTATDPTLAWGTMEAQISVGEGAVTPVGVLTTFSKILQSVGQGAITAVGSLNRKIKLAIGSGSITPIGTLAAIRKLLVGEGVITPAGALNRIIKLLVGEGSITPVGVLSGLGRFVQNVGQGAITAVGTLNRKIKLTIGQGAITPIGALAGVIKFWQNVGQGIITPIGALSYVSKILQNVGQGAITPVGTLSLDMLRRLILKVTEGDIYRMVVNEGMIYRLKTIAGRIYRLVTKEG